MINTREIYERNKILINNLLYSAGFLAVIYLAFKYALDYVLPFAAGYVIAAALKAPTDFLTRRLKIYRSVTALFLILICCALLGLVGTFAFARAQKELEALSSDLPKLAEAARGMADNVKNTAIGVVSLVPEEYREALNAAASSALVSFGDTLAQFVRTKSMSAISRVPVWLMNLLLSIISAYFFLKDWKRIAESVTSALGGWAARQMSLIRGGLITAVGGYARAQLVLMSLIGAICALGLTILGNPYAILIAAVACFIDALPVFGLGALFWPWIAASFITGKISVAVGLTVIYVVCFLTRHMLEPKIVGQQIGVHPLLTLLSLYAGLKLFGILGLIIGPMTVISLKMALAAKMDAGSG